MYVDSSGVTYVVGEDHPTTITSDPPYISMPIEIIRFFAPKTQDGRIEFESHDAIRYESHDRRMHEWCSAVLLL